MKEYSNGTKIGITLALQVITYALVVTNVVLMEYYWVSDLTINMSFVITFLLMIVPTVIAVKIFNIKYRGLLWGAIVIYICVQIFSPDGFYLLVYKGNWFLTPAEPIWLYGILISIEFFIVQSFGFAIGYATTEDKTEKSSNENEPAKDDTLNQPDSKE